VANYQLKKYDRAIRHLEAGRKFVVGNDKLLAQFWSSLGDGYHQQGENRKAYDAYEKALELEPDNSIVLNNYAYYLSLDGIELEKAEEMSKKAVELDPGNSANQDTYGWVLYKMGNYEEAEKWIGKAIADSEAGAVVLEHYGDVLFKLGKQREAVKYWEKALKEGEGSEFLERKVKDKTLYE
jgi:Tfp pilus assembly protein PilF